MTSVIYLKPVSATLSSPPSCGACNQTPSTSPFPAPRQTALLLAASHSRRKEASARRAESRVKSLSRMLLGCRVPSEIDALRIRAARPSSCMRPGQSKAHADHLEFADEGNFGNDGNGSPVHPCLHQNQSRPSPPTTLCFFSFSVRTSLPSAFRVRLLSLVTVTRLPVLRGSSTLYSIPP